MAAQKVIQMLVLHVAIQTLMDTTRVIAADFFGQLY
jgi:hypothetical protein